MLFFSTLSQRYATRNMGCVSFFPSVQKLRTCKRLSPTSLKTLKIVFAVVFETKHLQLHALFLTGFGASLPPVLSSDAAQALLGLVVAALFLGHRIIVSRTASIA